MLNVEICEAVSGLSVGIVQASGLTIAESDSVLRDYCDHAVAQVLQEGPAGGDEHRQHVRAMLRVGGFKPAGRNKPAQEYLARTVEKEGSLPAILNVVDLLNAVSLKSGLPISMLAADRLGASSLLRYGQQDESFVFNRAGQELSLTGLICWCSDQDGDFTPLGSPVKNSMAGKVTEKDTGIAVCVYAPAESVTGNELQRIADEFGDGLVRWCGATEYESDVVSCH